MVEMAASEFAGEFLVAQRRFGAFFPLSAISHQLWALQGFHMQVATANMVCRLISGRCDTCRPRVADEWLLDRSAETPPAKFFENNLRRRCNAPDNAEGRQK